ncbi:MAG: DUF4418 family protein [Synergistaceae bacterium]|jgi:hypothetical protein|nr:DUF4418 family protein [Synergistaceae bacterium]
MGNSKNRVSVGTAAVVLGGLVALGPQYMFKICEQMHHGVTNCYWIGQAEIGAGAVVAAFGITYLLFRDAGIHAGLSIGIFIGGVLTLLLADVLLRACEEANMSCHLVTLPALNIVGTLIVILAALNTAYLFRKTGREFPSNV